MKSGHIDFGTVKAGKSLEGELDLLFTNGIRVRKRFHAADSLQLPVTTQVSGTVANRFVKAMISIGKWSRCLVIGYG